MDFFDLVSKDTALKKAGQYFCGPCPFCKAGVDRFVVHNTPNGWRWFCRYCGQGRYHDDIDYLMRREKISFKEAKAMLENGNGGQQREQRQASQPDPVWKPGDVWQQQGLTFVAHCIAALWSVEGENALSYLHSRGLGDDVIYKYNVGYNAHTAYEDGEKWGFDGSNKVVLERGIVFPAFADEALYYIKIRRPTLDPNEKKYVQVKGSRPGIFGYDNLKGASLGVICEGEIDCMTFDQQCNDMAAALCLGSAQVSPSSIDPNLTLGLLAVPEIIIVYDNDIPGQEGAMKLQEKLPRALIASLPEGSKDINEFHCKRNDLGKWFAREYERLSGVVVDEELDF